MVFKSSISMCVCTDLVTPHKQTAQLTVKDNYLLRYMRSSGPKIDKQQMIINTHA